MSETPRRRIELSAASWVGDPAAAARLLPVVYRELRAIAGRLMKHERPNHTLQPTALVHEAYLRLVDNDRIDWRGRTHFLAMAAGQMRRLLVDHARAARAGKRGGGWRRVTLREDAGVTPDSTIEILALDEALTKLERLSQRQSRVAELRIFAGLDVRESAFLLGVSERTIKADWRVARIWLLRELAPRTEASS